MPHLNELASALATHGAFSTSLDRTDTGIRFLSVFAHGTDDALGAAILMTDEPRLRGDASRTRPASGDPLGYVDNDSGKLHEFANAGELVAWLEAHSAS
jgi:hypothetical protein